MEGSYTTRRSPADSELATGTLRRCLSRHFLAKGLKHPSWNLRRREGGTCSWAASGVREWDCLANGSCPPEGLGVSWRWVGAVFACQQEVKKVLGRRWVLNVRRKEDANDGKSLNCGRNLRVLPGYLFQL